MTCNDVRVLLNGWIDRELDPAVVDAIQAHLAGCAACKAESEELVQLKQALAKAPWPQAPIELEHRIVEALDAPREKSVPIWRFVVAAAAIALIGLALFTIRPTTRTREQLVEAVARSYDLEEKDKATHCT